MKIIGPNGNPLSIDEVAALPSDPTGDPTMKLQAVEIEAFMGIRHAEFDVGDGGTLFVGKSKSGKTSAINAIYAALKSRGFGPECIHDNADRWRVLLKFDQATVQTTVRRSGSKEVKVDGLGLGSPQAKLDAVFPDLIDPWKLALATPEERRRRILAAMFVAATAEDLQRWTGEALPAPDGERHGLDVVKELHARYYAERATANKAAKDAKAAHKLAQDTAEGLAKPEHVGVTIPLPGQEDEPVRAAEKAREALEQRRQQAEAMAKRTEGTRTKIEGLRYQIDHLAARPGAIPPSPEEIDASDMEFNRATEALEEARRRMDNARKATDAMRERIRISDAIKASAVQLRQQAADLESTLAETAIDLPTADEIAQAEAAVVQARAHAELVRSARAAHDATVKVGAMVDEATAAEAEAERLNRIVKTLATDAPVELAARANLIPGLTLTEDGVLYQGRPIDDSMSGAQRMLVAVQIAKRANANAGLLLVDEIGIMDDEKLREFVKLCTADGWQLISTCMKNVTGPDGKPTREMVLEAIELDQDQAGAAA